MDNIVFLKDLSKKIRDDANYFDEAHEYDRMNDLDKIKNILDASIPIIEAVMKIKESNDLNMHFYPIKDIDAFNLKKVIEKSKIMKPFELIDN